MDDEFNTNELALDEEDTAELNEVDEEEDTEDDPSLPEDDEGALVGDDDEDSDELDTINTILSQQFEDQY